MSKTNLRNAALLIAGAAILALSSLLSHHGALGGIIRAISEHRPLIMGNGSRLRAQAPCISGLAVYAASVWLTMRGIMGDQRRRMAWMTILVLGLLVLLILGAASVLAFCPSGMYTFSDDATWPHRVM